MRGGGDGGGIGLLDLLLQSGWRRKRRDRELLS
jgi:hypothetical protein